MTKQQLAVGSLLSVATVGSIYMARPTKKEQPVVVHPIHCEAICGAPEKARPPNKKCDCKKDLGKQ